MVRYHAERLQRSRQRKEQKTKRLVKRTLPEFKIGRIIEKKKKNTSYRRLFSSFFLQIKLFQSLKKRCRKD